MNFDQTIETRILEVRLHIGVHHVVGTVALVKSRKHVLTFCPISRKHVPAEMMKNDQFGPTVLKNGMIHDDPLPNINNATPWDSAEIFQQEMGFPRIIYVSIWPWTYSDGHTHLEHHLLSKMKTPTNRRGFGIDLGFFFDDFCLGFGLGAVFLELTLALHKGANGHVSGAGNGARGAAAGGVVVAAVVAVLFLLLKLLFCC